MQSKQKGFIPVMLTPFQEDGKIDYPKLSQLTEFYMKAGAKALFANCLSSEMFELSAEEKIAVTRHVVEVVGGAIPVLSSGSFGDTLTHQADFTKRIADTGVQAVIIITSLMAEETDSDALLEEKLLKFTELTKDIPLGLYECPVPYKRLISPALLKTLAATNRFFYQKDTCLDIQQIREKVEVTKDSNLAIFDAYMVHAVESLKAGSAGLCCIQGNYFPELIVWLCNHFDDATKVPEVNYVQQFLINQMDVMHDIYPIVSKYFLQLRGIDFPIKTRRDVGILDAAKKAEIQGLYTEYLKLKAEIGLT